MIRAALAFCLVCLAPPSILRAGPVEDVVASLEHLEVSLGVEDRALIRHEVAGAPMAERHPDWFALSAPLLADMAMLSRNADHAATRARLAETHRHLLQRMLGADSHALSLVAAPDPDTEIFEPMLAMTEKDLAAAVLLEAMRRDLPADAHTFAPDPSQARTIRAEIVATFPDHNSGQQHFLSRLDAWAAGTLAVWKDLSPTERHIAASVVTQSQMPPARLLRQVIGSTDLLLWLAGMNLAFNENERAAYPELMAYLEAGYMAGSIDAILAKRVARMNGLAELNAKMMATTTMMELNYGLLFGPGMQ